jgi:hypothetical protein
MQFKMEEIQSPDKPFSSTQIQMHYNRIGNTLIYVGMTTNGKFVRACDTVPRQHIVIKIPSDIPEKIELKVIHSEPTCNKYTS